MINFTIPKKKINNLRCCWRGICWRCVKQNGFLAHPATHSSNNVLSNNCCNKFYCSFLHFLMLVASDGPYFIWLSFYEVIVHQLSYVQLYNTQLIYLISRAKPLLNGDYKQSVHTFIHLLWYPLRKKVWETLICNTT